MSEEKRLPIDKDGSDDPLKNEEVLPTEQDDTLTDPNPTQNPSVSPSGKDTSTTSQTASTTTFVKSVWSPARSDLSQKDDGNTIPKVLELSLTGAVKSLTLEEQASDLGARDDSSNIDDLPSPECVPLATRSIVEEIHQSQREIIKAINQSQREVLGATQWPHAVPFESREELGAIGGDDRQYLFGVRTPQENQNTMRESQEDFRVMFVSREAVLNAIRRSRREILDAIRQPQEEILQAVSRLSRELNRRDLALMEEVRGPREMMEATSGWRPQEFLEEDTLYEMWRPPKHIFDEYQESRRQEEIDRKKQQRAFAKTMGFPDPEDEDFDEEEDEEEFSEE